MKKKKTGIWIFMMIFPVPSLILISLLQVAARALGLHNNAVATLLNIIAFLVGMAAVIGLIGIPLWIIMYLRADKYNKSLAQGNKING